MDIDEICFALGMTPEAMSPLFARLSAAGFEIVRRRTIAVATNAVSLHEIPIPTIPDLPQQPVA